MKLSLQLILETLTEYGAQLIETDGDFAFTGVQILTSPTDILEPDTLYVCTPKVLPKLKKQLFEDHCFVFKAKPSQLQCHHALHGILLDENTDLNEVVTTPCSRSLTSCSVWATTRRSFAARAR